MRKRRDLMRRWSMRWRPTLRLRPSANETRFLQAVAIGDEDSAHAVDEGGQHLNTASSWHPPADQRFVSYSSRLQH